MGIWRRIICTFSPRSNCSRWNAEEDDVIQFLRSERRSAEDAAAKIRRQARPPGDPITRVYGGWDRKDRTR